MNFCLSAATLLLQAAGQQEQWLQEMSKLPEQISFRAQNTGFQLCVLTIKPVLTQTAGSWLHSIKENADTVIWNGCLSFHTNRFKHRLGLEGKRGGRGEGTSYQIPNKWPFSANKQQWERMAGKGMGSQGAQCVNRQGWDFLPALPRLHPSSLRSFFTPASVSSVCFTCQGHGNSEIHPDALKNRWHTGASRLVFLTFI